MKNRLLTAAFALPILIAAIILPWFFPTIKGLDLIFVVLVAIAMVVALIEFFSLTKKLELKADPSMGFIGAILFFLAFIFDAPREAPELLGITLVLFLIIVLISQTFRFRKDFSKMLGGVGVTLLGVLFIVFLGGHLISIRVGFEQIPGLSSKLLLYFFLVTMGSDVGAYFIGKGIGKHKLVPAISPGKTWEGFIGGVLVAAGFAALSTFWFFPELGFEVSIPLGILMAMIGVFGDLTESAMKRGAKTKDTAKILPGHGGMLDRLDSLLFNAPILYYFARFYFG